MTRPHWYYVTYSECPVCGRVDMYRERRYDAKPTDLQMRCEYSQRYDWCAS